MGIRKYSPYTPSRRNMTGLDFTEITKNAPEKSLTVSLKKNSGRNRNIQAVNFSASWNGNNFVTLFLQKPGNSATFASHYDTSFFWKFYF